MRSAYSLLDCVYTHSYSQNQRRIVYNTYMKLLITGGHLAPALACIDILQKEHPDVEIIFVGRKFAQASDNKPTLEYTEITQRNIAFHNLSAGRVTRTISFQSLQNILKIPIGFWQAYHILREVKPDKILSFGGFLAVPIAIIGKLLGIPVFTHEQTIEPGLANKTIAKFAQKIFVSFPETENYFPASKVVITGNPIRDHVFTITNKPFELKKSRPVIYITGGSLGAHGINVHIEHILLKLLEKYTVIHQVGNVAEYGDYQRLRQWSDGFAPELYANYHLYAHFTTDQIGYIFSVADLVISRSGANTFFELAALQKPTIFIPLPISARGEQQKHAAIFETYGVGEVFEQSRSSQELLQLVDKMMKNLSHYKDNFKKFPSVYVQKAAYTIIAAVLQKK